MASAASQRTKSKAAATAVRDHMRPALTSVERNAHVAAAAYLMRRANQSALVVISDDTERRPLAVVTETDVAHAVADKKNLDELQLSDLVSRDPVTISPNASLQTAVKRMLSAHVRQLPVVERGHLIGMLDVSAACRALLDEDRQLGHK
jgi:CBS domain-containing protein